MEVSVGVLRGGGGFRHFDLCLSVHITTTTAAVNMDTQDDLHRCT